MTTTSTVTTTNILFALTAGVFDKLYVSETILSWRFFIAFVYVYILPVIVVLSPISLKAKKTVFKLWLIVFAIFYILNLALLVYLTYGLGADVAPGDTVENAEDNRLKDLLYGEDSGFVYNPPEISYIIGAVAILGILLTTIFFLFNNKSLEAPMKYSKNILCDSMYAPKFLQSNFCESGF